MTLWASALIRRLIASVVFVWAMSAASASANPILSIDPATTTVNVGDTFSVDVNIAGITDLYAFQFDVMFNDALLDPVFVPPDLADPFDPGGYSTEGSFLSIGGPTFFNKGSYADGDGKVAFTFALLLGAVPGVSGDGTLATLTFAATAAGPATFSLGGILLTDSSGNLININGVNDTTTVGQLLSILLCGTGIGAIVRRRFERISRS
jgi:hypothetical protein